MRKKLILIAIAMLCVFGTSVSIAAQHQQWKYSERCCPQQRYDEHCCVKHSDIIEQLKPILQDRYTSKSTSPRADYQIDSKVIQLTKEIRRALKTNKDLNINYPKFRARKGIQKNKVFK